MGGKTSYESKKKYEDKAYDRISLLLKKGEKDIIKEHAEKLGVSVNEYIRQAIKEKMELVNENQE